MSERFNEYVELLPAADGRLWIARRQANGDLLVFDAVGEREPVRVEGASNQWAATVDHAGIPWVVTSEDHTIHARRCQDGRWGPRLQVSTRPDKAVDPVVIADEYANVWIFWRYVEASELWLCRMGPRSGQETRVAPAGATRLLRATTREGRFYVLYEADGRSLLATGTEHGGFGAPVEADT